MEQIPPSAGSLAAVVVTYNRCDKLSVTLSRLFETPPDILSHVVVVDNASSDETPAWLAAQTEPRLHVVTLPVNSGGAGGFDAGMRYAQERLTPDWLVVMDDDAYPSVGTLERFHAVPRDACDGWLAAVRYPQGEICDMNRPWRNPFWHRATFGEALLKGREGFHLGPQAYQADDPCPVDGGSFVGLFLSRAAIETAGYPDPALFIYGDDVLYTLGLAARGGKLAFDPALRFEHDCYSIHGGAQVLRPLWKAYYFHRNLLQVYRKAAGPFFWPAMAMILPKWWLRSRLYGDEAPRFRRILRRAVADGLRQRNTLSHPEVLALTERD